MVNKCFASKGGFVDSMIGALTSFIALLEGLHYNAPHHETGV
jgi:hypothetical protein